MVVPGLSLVKPIVSLSVSTENKNVKCGEIAKLAEWMWNRKNEKYGNISRQKKNRSMKELLITMERASFTLKAQTGHSFNAMF